MEREADWVDRCSGAEKGILDDWSAMKMTVRECQDRRPRI